MRLAVLILSTATLLFPQSSARDLVQQLPSLRAALGSFHQEMEVSELLLFEDRPQSSEWKISIDAQGETWRENRVTGWSDKDRYLINAELLTVDEGVGEFTRQKARGKLLPLPEPYSDAADSANLEWNKAVEIETRPCGLPVGKVCRLFQVPLVKRIQFLGTKERRRLEGTSLVLIDPSTGLIVSFATTEVIEQAKERFAVRTEYTTTALRLKAEAFPLNTSQLREVKSLSAWDAKQVQRALVGKTAPALSVVDMEGKQVSLSSLAGKTVLLDFWASWCPPCRADAPDLNKLQSKYGGRELVILGINVAEDRAIVDEFLRKYQGKYPVILTSENQIPRQYQVYAIPTYIVIGADGKLVSASDGEKGFGELKSMLKKAGLDTDQK